MSRRLLSSLASCCVLAAVSFAPAAFAQAQDTQTESIADAARRSRELKKNSAKTSKVVTDDDLEKKSAQPGEPSVPAEAAPAETQPTGVKAGTATEATGNAAPPEAAKAEEIAVEEKELANLKGQLAQAQKELDLDQRELALDQDTHFSNPDYQRDDVGKTKLNTDQQQINDKQEQIDRIKTRIAAVQELLNRAKSKASAPAAPETKPPAASQS